MNVARRGATAQAQLRRADRLAAQLRELYDAHEFQEALRIAKTVLKIVAGIFSEFAPEVLDARRNIAELLRVCGQPLKAETELRAIMKIETRLRRTQQKGFSETCNNLATCLIDQRRYPEAVGYLKRSISVLAKLSDANMRSIVISSKNLGNVQARSGAIEDAVDSFLHAFQLCLKPGQNLLADAGDCLDNLVPLLLRLGRGDEAETLTEQASAFSESGHDSGFLPIQTMLCRGEICGARIRRREAAQWNRKAWERSVREISPGPGYSLAIRAAIALAANYSDLGMFNEALQMAEWAVREAPNEARDQVPFRDLMAVLGKMLRQAGHLHRARACLLEVFRLEENQHEMEGDGSAGTLESLALLNSEQGRTSEAIHCAECALELGLRLKLGAHRIRPMLRLLSSLLADAGEIIRAEACLQQALALVDPVESMDEEETARIVHSLGSLSERQGDFPRAEENYRKALRLIVARTGSEFDLATTATWNNLGVLAHRQRRYDEAAGCYDHALQANRGGHDDSHPESVSTLFNLSAVEWARGNWTRALDLRAQGVRWSLTRLPILLAGGNENDRRHAVETLRGRIYSTISFHLENPADRQSSARIAAAIIVQAKGRALDAMTWDLARLHTAAKDGATALILRRLRRLRHCLSELSFRAGFESVPRFKARLRRLQLQEERLLDQLHASIIPDKTVPKDVTPETVAASLPPGSALIEYVRFGLYRAASGEWDGYRYAALLLRKDMAPVVIEAGESESAEKHAQLFHSALSGSDKNYYEPARRLHDIVFEPLLPYLTGVTSLFIVPDGLLNAIPFAALIGRDDRFLVQSYVISYLSSARDLVRQFHRPRQAPLFVLDAADPTIQRGLNLEQHLAREFFPDARVLTDFRQARHLLSGLHGPRVLHLAMHGAFLNDESERSSERTSDDLPAEQMGMLNAVLVMREGDRVRILLTALEAAALDLHGTQLVVMATCESGVGMILNGEGIYGFRRALTLAGAAAQISTLWPVEDLSMAELVKRFYRAARKQPAPRALALAQRNLLLFAKWKHPHYWAPVALSCGPQPLQLQDDGQAIS